MIVQTAEAPYIFTTDVILPRAPMKTILVMTTINVQNTHNTRSQLIYAIYVCPLVLSKYLFLLAIDHYL